MEFDDDVACNFFPHSVTQRSSRIGGFIQPVWLGPQFCAVKVAQKQHSDNNSCSRGLHCSCFACEKGREGKGREGKGKGREGKGREGKRSEVKRREEKRRNLKDLAHEFE